MILLRLFIAINFAEEIKDKIFATIQNLKSYTSKGNFTKKENIHQTLVFIGETTKIDTVKQCMESVSAPPFRLDIHGLGCFPRDSGNIYWLGVKVNDTLYAIYKQLYNSLTANGFIIDSRPYKPHLTLGREIVLKRNNNIELFKQKIAPISIDVAYISLMKSERVSGKLIYTEIFRKELEGKKELY